MMRLRSGGGGAGIECRLLSVGVLWGYARGGGGGGGVGGPFGWDNRRTSCGQALSREVFVLAVEESGGVDLRNELGMINR